MRTTSMDKKRDEKDNVEIERKAKRKTNKREKEMSCLFIHNNKINAVCYYVTLLIAVVCVCVLHWQTYALRTDEQHKKTTISKCAR